MRVAVVGCGAVGRVVAALHARSGGPVALVSRDEARGRSAAAEVGPGTEALAPGGVAAWSPDVVIVAVPDRALGAVGAALRASGCEGLALHTSGALPGDVVGGARAGSLHPLQSFPASATLRDLIARADGIRWFHEGDGAREAESLVQAWTGRFHALAPGSKALYHAGAAILSNHTVALFADAVRLFGAAGIGHDAAAGALAGLLAGTAANLASLGVPDALTGPVARGDVETVRGHLAALRRSAPDLLPSYVAMARRAAVVAREKGSLDAAAGDALEMALAAALAASPVA
jgi:predicted short-subunit dehydrogenase-like oxidoreductase (DUF2520 family)